MQDNQLVQDLVESILASVNASRLPLGVKALALENLLLRVKLTMCATADPADEPVPATEPEKENTHA